MEGYDLLGVIAVVVSVCGVLVWGLGGKARQSANDSLSLENKSVRNQNGDLKAQVAVMAAQAKKSEENEAYLKELVLNRPDINKMVVTLGAQHQEVMENFKDMIVKITDLTKAIAEDRNNGQ